MFARTLPSKRAFAALAITLLGTAALMIGSASAAGAATTTGVPSHHSVVSAKSTRVTPSPQATTPCGAFQFNFAEFNRCTGSTWAGALCQVNANYNGNNGPFNVLAAASDCGTRVWVFEVNRGRVFGRSPSVIAMAWRSGIAGRSVCRRSGRAGAGSRDYGTNRPCGLLVSRSGSGPRTWHWSPRSGLLRRSRPPTAISSGPA